MERKPQYPKFIFQMVEPEEPMVRDSDQMYWSRRFDYLALSTANEHLGEVKLTYDT
jgi:hypothetical protein